MIQQTQYLVVTAIGSDRTGIISDLTNVVHNCNCNILDSRMAIFGQEFTFIMLLSGDRLAISKIENTLPSTSHELGLLTMMKRTTRHTTISDAKTFNIDYSGPDIPGTLNTVTVFLASRNVDISSLKVDAHHDNDNVSNHSTDLIIRLSEQVDVEEFTTALTDLCTQLHQTLTLTQIS